jgi:ankyrin repeat protein
MKMNHKRCAKYVSLSLAALFFGPMQGMDCGPETEGALHNFAQAAQKKKYSKRELTKKDDRGVTLLWRLVHEHNKDEAENALVQGADPNERRENLSREPEHMLGWMIEHPEYDPVKKIYDYSLARSLLLHGARVTFRDPIFDIPLIHILGRVKELCERQEQLLKFFDAEKLREHQERNCRNERVLCSFIQSLVHDYNVDPDMCSRSGQYPLMFLPYFWNPEVQKMLAQSFLDHGAELEEQDLNGQTALLHVANSVVDTTQLAGYLLERGAKLQHRDNSLNRNSVVRLVAIARVKKPNLYSFLIGKAPELAPEDPIALRYLEALREEQ